MALWVRTDASSWVDCHGTSRVEPMKVLSLGLSRTAVTGSVRALRLGYNSAYENHHGQNPPDLDMWIDALNSRFFGKGPGPRLAGPEWEQLLGHCEVCTEPGVSLAQELAPTTRYYGKTSGSDESVAKLGRNKPFVVASCLDPRFLGRLRPFFRLVWMTFFGDFPSGEDIARKHFEGALGGGEGDVPKPGRLLEYKVGEGWERVCILLESESESSADVEETEDSTAPPIMGDTRAFGAKMNKLTYGVFQGLGGTVVMQTALVGSVGVSISFAHRNL